MKRYLISKYVYTILFLILILNTFVFFSCGVFVSPYDPYCYKNLTSLKAYHQKFVDDFTSTQGKSWDDTVLTARCNEGDLRFREAIEYENALHRQDRTRIQALEILHNQFMEDCSYLKENAKKGKYFFNVQFAIQLKQELEENYGYAIAGEVARMISPLNLKEITNE